MVKLSFQAKSRLAFLEFYQQVKDVSVTCKVFKISRQTFYKWRTRYQPDNLSSLEDRSKALKTKRKGILTIQQEDNIRKMRKRKKNIRLGKLKLAILYEQEHGEKISSWQIQKVIEKHGLYFDPIKAKKIRTKKRKSWSKRKIRIHEVNPQDYFTEDKPFFFCPDCIVLYLPWGIKRYILTAVDRFNKLAYAKTYRTKASSNAFDFLLRLNLLTEGKIAAILSDNGGEWKKYFEAACQRLNIAHIWTRFKTPKDNAVSERFNRTLQEEFMATDEYFEEYLLDKNLIKANQALTEWLIFYNFKRPHQIL